MTLPRGGTPFAMTGQMLVEHGHALGDDVRGWWVQIGDERRPYRIVHQDVRRDVVTVERVPLLLVWAVRVRNEARWLWQDSPLQSWLASRRRSVVR